MGWLKVIVGVVLQVMAKSGVLGNLTRVAELTGVVLFSVGATEAGFLTMPPGVQGGARADLTAGGSSQTAGQGIEGGATADITPKASPTGILLLVAGAVVLMIIGGRR